MRTFLVYTTPYNDAMLAVHEIYYSLCEAHRYFGNPEKAIPYFKTTLKRAKVKKDKATAAFCQEYIFNWYCDIGEIDTVAFRKK